ncbi:proteasome-type protease [Nitrospirillum viridazoti]|uniref:Peptidase n=1 Tax=Nitrospirillum viridazoti CBAmc TaxID=1441467 RepID=A0A248K0Z7_9PROT|nr:proteasome-type protease [Nitrospirillum amazonense]ASG24612.1 peptidase [Nitrospirillum amazonense CBAmc]TWB37025.1 putative proteasome-type protease [Nitrospirillum amazonense]
MTYCVALFLKAGLVMLSDTRTNAGVDNISTFCKMHRFETPGERCMVLLTAGNLSISQSVVNRLHEGVSIGDADPETLATVPSMFRAAQLVGAAIRDVYNSDGLAMKAQGVGFDASFLLGGQIRGRGMRLFQIYSPGNFIEATPETPYLQIGEHKYGKPILDRVVSYDTPVQDGVKLVLVSMDSTLRSNLSVGMPIDLAVYHRDDMQLRIHRRITETDSYFQHVRDHWSNALRQSYGTLPTADEWWAGERQV